MPNISYSLSLSGEFNFSQVAGASYTSAVIYEPYTIANGTTDESLPFGSIANSASIVVLQSDQDLTIKLDANTANAITILANRPFFNAGANVSAIYLTNASGNTANVSAFIGGD